MNLTDLTMSLGLQECFVFSCISKAKDIRELSSLISLVKPSIEICICHISNILKKVWKLFPSSSFHLIFAKNFVLFDLLFSPWCNFFCHFSFLQRLLSLFFRLEILKALMESRVFRIEDSMVL